MIPGFIGKIPSQGDFVHRRLPWEFIECWDAWMQEGIHSIKALLGARWLDSYLVAPVWRFLLTEGVCAQAAWLGLWFPSVDRVGRHFPLTVAIPLQGRHAHPTLLLRLDPWLTKVEEAALNALDPKLTLEQFDISLQALACELPDDIPAPDPTPHTGPIAVHILDTDANAQQFAELLNARPAHGRATTYWHTWGTERVPTTYLISPNMPGKEYFSACLTGDWHQAGLATRVIA